MPGTRESVASYMSMLNNVAAAKISTVVPQQQSCLRDFMCSANVMGGASVAVSFANIGRFFFLEVCTTQHVFQMFLLTVWPGL